MRMVTAFVGPNQVAEGFYKVEGNTLTMLRRDGEPILIDENTVTKELSPGSNAEQVAKFLTKKIRKARRGERVEGFDRVISYPVDGGVV